MGNEAIGRTRDIEAKAADMRRKVNDSMFRILNLIRNAKNDERLEALHNYQGELKEDILMERDIQLILRDFIFAFRDLMFIIRDLERVEATEGKQAQAIHKRFMGSLESEIRVIVNELNSLMSIEKRTH